MIPSDSNDQRRRASDVLSIEAGRPSHSMTEASTAVNTPRPSTSHFGFSLKKDENETGDEASPSPSRRASDFDPHSRPSIPHRFESQITTASSFVSAPETQCPVEDGEPSREQIPRGAVEVSEHLAKKPRTCTQDGSAVIVGFEGPDDPLDPHNEPSWKKIALNLTIAINAFLISAFASAYLFVATNIESDFNTSRELVITGFVCYVLMWGPGPLIWAPLSNSIGRKPVYIFSVASWTLLNVGCARAPGINTLIGCRLLSGFLGSGCLCNGSGSSTDMWTGHARTKAVTLYSFVVFLGPVAGPLAGGAVSTYASPSPDGGWRWIFYAGIAAGTVVTIMHCLVIETNHNIRLRRRVRKLNKEQAKQERTDEKVARASTQQEQPLHYVTEEDRFGSSLTKKIANVSLSAVKMIVEEPIILFISLWQTTVMAVLYLFFEAYPVVFGEGHGFSAFQTGLCFLGVGVGMISACLWGITGELKLWERRLAKNHGESKPEMRVPQGLAGAVLTVIGLFWFGYTSFPSVHWIVPILGSTVYGMGAISVMLASMSFIVDTYLTRAAPAFAAVGLIRSIVTAVLPLVGTQMFHNLNPRNATLILALLACLQIATPLAAIKYGEKLRHRSRFALKTT